MRLYSSPLVVRSVYTIPSVDALPRSRRARSRLTTGLRASSPEPPTSSTAPRYPSWKLPAFPPNFTPATGLMMLRVYTRFFGIVKISVPSRKKGRFSSKKSANRSLTAICPASASTWLKSGL